jgi:hypothetical protein
MPQGMDQNGQMGNSTRGQRGQQGGSGREMGGMDQMTERFQELLGCTDEEWSVIGPRVLNLFTLSNQSSGGSMRSIFGRSSRGDDTNSRRGGTEDSDSEEDELLERLQELLDEENPSTSEIKSLMNEIRQARQAAEQELAQAQKELRELLTLRQEAILFAMGMLD